MTKLSLFSLKELIRRVECSLQTQKEEGRNLSFVFLLERNSRIIAGRSCDVFRDLTWISPSCHEQGLKVENLIAPFNLNVPVTL